MVFLCDNCQVFFQRRLINCPFCGGKIYTENISKESLLQDGYSLATLKSDNNSKNESDDLFSLDDSDIIASLRNSYHREHTPTALQEHGQNVTRHGHGQSSVPESTQNNGQNSSSKTDNDNGFFSRFQSSETNEEIPTVPHTPTPIPEIGVSTANTVDAELQSIERQQRRIRNNYRRIALLNFLCNIRWNIVFRILLVAFIVFCALTIWEMRYVILDSIMNFLLSLIPIIIIIWIITSLIKSLFK